MSRLFFICLGFAALLPAASFAAEFETPSAIKAVTVYTNRAKLTREAVVDLPAGAHTVIFKDLPAGIVPDSLRVEGRAAASVKFGALAHKQTVDRDLVSQRERELNTKLEELQAARSGVVAEKTALVAQKTFLDNLGTQAALRSAEDIAAIDLKPDQWAAAAETIRAGYADILGKDVALDTKLRELDKDIARVQTEIGTLYTGRKTSWEVRIPLESAAATKLTVDLSYQVAGATWHPLYDARLDTKSGGMDLVQYGEVQQNTGEDWSGVTLTLSTAQPERGAGLPEMQPWWVNIFMPQPMPMAFGGAAMQKTMAARSMVAAPEMAMMDSAMEAPPEMREEKAVFAAAAIETGGFVGEYKIAGPADVPADGTATKLMVGAFDTQSALEIQVKPQMGTDAYLVAKTTLKGDAPILPGRVSLFRDGAYVGQSSLPLLRPGQEKDLPFGIDDQVSVVRNVVMDERSEAGVISKDNVQERHFVTKIRNLHTMPVTLVVMETVPVAQDEKIRVETVKSATTAGYRADRDDIKGLLEWSLDLAAKEEKDIALGWKVSWPKDAQISGM